MNALTDSLILAALLALFIATNEWANRINRRKP